MSLSTKYGVSLLLVIIAGLSIYGLFCYTRDRSRIVLPADVSISAPALADSFDDAEGRSDSLFLYKTVSVTGIVKSLYKDASGTYIVSLTGHRPGKADLDCFLDSLYLPARFDLNSGDSVAIKGRCTG